MTKLAFGLLLLVCLIGTGVGVSQAKEEDSCTSWQGYLIDKKCAAIKKVEPNVKAGLQKHTAKCALKGECRTTGYCVYANGQWLDLDDAGNSLAVKLFKTTKRKHGCFVEVEGILKILPVQLIEVDADSKVTVTRVSENRSIQAIRINEMDEPPGKWSL